MARKDGFRSGAFLIGPGTQALSARMLGEALVELRKAAGLSQTDAAREAGRKPSTLSKWEAGDQLPGRADLHYLVTQVYGRSQATAKELRKLADEAAEGPADNIPMKVADYEWLESQAARIDVYQTNVIPAPLQTEAYAREIIAAWDPDLTEMQIERLVRARMERQEQRFREGRLKLSIVLGESALRKAIGGPAVMREQLRHLLSRGAERNVELRFLPDAVGAHAGLAGSFTILRPRGERQRALVSIPTRGGDIYFSDPVPFEQAFRRIKRAALSHDESIAAIAAMSKELTG